MSLKAWTNLVQTHVLFQQEKKTRTLCNKLQNMESTKHAYFPLRKNLVWDQNPKPQLVLPVSCPLALQALRWERTGFKSAGDGVGTNRNPAIAKP
jgi:hypothetical protein